LVFIREVANRNDLMREFYRSIHASLRLQTGVSCAAGNDEFVVRSSLTCRLDCAAVPAWLTKKNSFDQRRLSFD
jgi:hypothetical protein